jgi:hypothetical protein
MHVVLVAGLDDVQQRGGGAVELDERKGERPVPPVLRPRGRHPGPRAHHTAVPDPDELITRRAKLRVVVGRRDDHPAIDGATPPQLAARQPGEESFA